MGEDPPERPGGLEGPFSPGHALWLPVWGLRGEDQVDTEVKRRQWVLAEETWTSEGLEDHVAHSIRSTDRHHREGIQTYIRGLTDSFLKLEAAGRRKEQRCSPERPGGHRDLDSSASAPPGTWAFHPPSSREPSGDDHLCRASAVTLERWAGHRTPHAWPSLKGRGPQGLVLN